ncbi:erythromycin esterase family protein [Occultella glacieicola]|uniref:Erythromycin esterase family protein n=1 Tax=Occultella glacieicola TaxID=2518684 RepID=A0ABY2DZC7_9MICO|nr:erythromycin esterase family protein [Occultella glacieicola]TDE89501.1 erythromycin esterase family protein [Occultella glacieicola]
MRVRHTAFGLAAGVLALALVAPSTPAQGSPPTPTSAVTRWVERHAVAVPDDPTRPGRDLAAIARATAGAEVIGLGEPGHTIGEVTTLQARYLRHLVTHEGVRAIAFEMDWTLSLSVSDYVLGVRDDLDAVLDVQERIWRTTEFRDVLEWLRHYNDTHVTDVRIAGTEYFATGSPAYDAVEAHVAANAPDRMTELLTYFEWVRPDPGVDPRTHLGEYLAIVDKTPYVEAAAAVEQLVETIGGGDSGDLAAHHARQIHSWYEAFSLPWDDIPDYRDARSAENVRWWQHHTGARTVYWAASAHVADAPRLTITEPGEPDTTFASAGSHLEDWYGRHYVTIGFTFDHGTYLTEDGTTVAMPPASPGWFERPLADVRHAQFVVGLDRHVPRAVRDWLDAQLRTRGLPEYGSGSLAHGGTLREWFDVLVHTQEVTPAEPL